VVEVATAGPNRWRPAGAAEAEAPLVGGHVAQPDVLDDPPVPEPELEEAAPAHPLADGALGRAVDAAAVGGLEAEAAHHQVVLGDHLLDSEVPFGGRFM
jgi:hypothetical protein